MKRVWAIGLWMLAVSCAVPNAVAETAASGVTATQGETAASGVAATQGETEKIEYNAEHFYKLGQQTWANGELMETIWMYKTAADLGHEQSMILVANLYESSLRLFDAFVYYSKAANLGNTTAMISMALLLSGGQESEFARDYDEARKLMILAAEKGDRSAIVHFAAAHVRGGFGLTKEDRNGPQALHWLTRAAELDDVFATKVLAQAYRTGGLFGLTADVAEADKWDAKLTELSKRGEKPKEEVKKTSKKRRR